MATVVAFHAHPDDEVILTGGALARAAAAGRASRGCRCGDRRAPNGGYSHRDHVQVHHVGKRAAELAATPRVLEATMPRELLCRVGDAARLLRLPAPYDRDVVRSAYAPRSSITHRINVFWFARQKRAAFAAHRSQIRDNGLVARMFAILLRLPPEVFGLLFPREWFVDTAASSATVRRDIFD